MRLTWVLLHASEYARKSRFVLNEQLRPNLFAYATKELSQDAVICWLIEWSATAANHAGEHVLRNLGQSFVGALLGKHNVALAGDIRSAEIYQQDNGIDVLARIRDEKSEHVLLIEDKTGSEVHGDQLHRYLRAAMEGSTNLRKVPGSICPIYLKTGNQSLAGDRKVENSYFKVFHRADFLTVLNGYRHSHPIVTDFREHLQKVEDDSRSFDAWRQEDDRGNWSRAAWEGFYRRLELELEGEEGEIGWRYAPNPAGGFLGFHWSVASRGDAQFYLLLEVSPGSPDRQKLCLKVYRGEDQARMRAQDFYDRWFSPSGGELIERPQRFGSGANVTVGWWKGEWLAFDADGKLDIGAIAENLRKARDIVLQAHAASNDV